MKKGRPTKYRPEYCQEILDFFNIEPAKIVTRQVMTKNGPTTVENEVANPLPTIERFATKLNVTKSTIWKWEQENPEFSNVVERAKANQKDILIQNGLTGRYKEGFCKFVAINCTDMVDKSTQEVTGRSGGPIATTIYALSDEELLEIAARGTSKKYE